MFLVIYNVEKSETPPLLLKVQTFIKNNCYLENKKRKYSTLNMGSDLNCVDGIFILNKWAGYSKVGNLIMLKMKKLLHSI